MPEAPSGKSGDRGWCSLSPFWGREGLRRAALCVCPGSAGPLWAGVCRTPTPLIRLAAGWSPGSGSVVEVAFLDGQRSSVALWLGWPLGPAAAGQLGLCPPLSPAPLGPLVTASLQTDGVCPCPGPPERLVNHRSNLGSNITAPREPSLLCPVEMPAPASEPRSTHASPETDCLPPRERLFTCLSSSLFDSVALRLAQDLAQDLAHTRCLRRSPGE